MKSSIYTVRADENPRWEEPKEGDPIPPLANEGPGWVRATKEALPLPPDENFDFSRHVIHCQPGTPPPLNVVQVIVDGSKTPWTPSAIAQAWPSGSKYVMDATWPGKAKGPDGVERDQQIRGKMIEIPEGVTPTDTLIVPHQWAGESSEPPASNALPPA